MHIDGFISDQNKRNPEPKHWWQRRHIGYDRVFATLGLVAGAGIALFSINRMWHLNSLPEDFQSIGFGIALFFLLTGSFLGVLGTMNVMHVFSLRKQDGMSHLAGIALGVLLLSVLSPLLAYHQDGAEFNSQSLHATAGTSNGPQ